MSNKRVNKKEIDALINLLDDPDEGIFNHIRDKFISIGQPVIPFLENAWENAFDMLMQKRIEQIIHSIQFESLQKNLSDWSLHRQEDLLEGILLIARYQYPDLDEGKIKKQLQQIIHDCWLELNDDLTALEKIKIINHIIFDVHLFSANITNYHAPQNSFFNVVIESKKGNQISLSILYLLVAKSLNVPVYGVNLPEHFVVCYVEEKKNLLNLSSENEEPAKILFYINPFSKGIIFQKSDIDVFLKKLNIDPLPSFYYPCSNLDIIKRVLRNLIASYQKLGHNDKIDELNDLLNNLN